MKRKWPFKGRWPARYAVALLAVGAGLLARIALTAWVGPDLPPYLTFFPAVMVAALLAGLGPGLVATAIAALVTNYWILLPHGFEVETLSDAVGLALFACLGLFMSVVAEVYRRSRHTVAACEKELALRESQEKLRESQERLRLLGDNLPESAVYQYAHEPDGSARFLYFSAGVERLNGVTVENVLRDADTLLQQVLPEYRQSLVEAEARSARDLSDFDMDIPMRQSDGRVRWMRMHSRPRRMPGGRVIWDGVQTDVTERRQAAEVLRESERRMERAQEIAHLGSWELDLVQDRLSWSDEVYRIFGLEPRQFKPSYKAFLEAVHPDDRDAVHAAYSGSVREGRDTYEIEHRVVRPSSGEVRIVHEKCEHFRDASGRIVRSMGMVHDITERKLAEEALRRSETRLAQAVRVAGLGIFEHDHRSDAIEYSPVMRELLRFGEDEPITLAATLDRVLPEDRERLAEVIRRAHDPRGNGMFEVEYRVARPDGRIRWMSARSQTFFEGQGDERRPVRTIGAVLDVTERMEFQAGLERLVAERTAKLQEMVGELEHFSYTITHDMRAPLRAMKCFSEMTNELCAHCQEREPKSYLRRISVAADRMDMLITDALSYSKAVRQELALEPVDAAALLRGMLDTYPELQPGNAQIQIEGEIPLVMGNQAGLTQCFSNLLGNAVKFVNPGQVPRVRIWAELRGEGGGRLEDRGLRMENGGKERSEGENIEHSTLNIEPRSGDSAPSINHQPSTINSFVRLWFEDNGIGIPKSMQPRIFDMFSRGHQKYEGTGIGLALVRKVMERMGGKVGVESEEGKGSRFWLELKPGKVTRGWGG